MYVTSPYSFTEATGTSAAIAIDLDTMRSADTAFPTRSLKRGQSAFCEGDEAAGLYEVVSGVVRSTKLLADGRRQVVSFGYPGDIVGFSADGSHHSDCEAVCPARLRVIPQTAIGRDPQLGARVMRQAAAEVTSMQDHFIMLGRKCALEKVASFLCVLFDRVGEVDLHCPVSRSVTGAVCFDLPMSRSDIADFLGLTIETVSRTLTKLRKMGVIELPATHRVCVARPDRLRGLAERDE